MLNQHQRTKKQRDILHEYKPYGCMQTEWLTASTWLDIANNFRRLGAFFAQNAARVRFTFHAYALRGIWRCETRKKKKHTKGNSRALFTALFDQRAAGFILRYVNCFGNEQKRWRSYIFYIQSERVTWSVLCIYILADFLGAHVCSIEYAFRFRPRFCLLRSEQVWQTEGSLFKHHGFGWIYIYFFFNSRIYNML